MKRIVKILKINIIIMVLAVSYSPGYCEIPFRDNFEAQAMIEARVGYRTGEDKKQKANSVTDFRFRGEISGYFDDFEIKYTGDYWYDNVRDQLKLKTREAWIFFRPSDNADIKAGRQILTWGTGDLVFLNDLFPKDWQSFFIGRNDEYLKAPCDSLKVSLFTDLVDIDLIYNPVFKSDRFIDGTYISFWDQSKGSFAGSEDFPGKSKPDSYFVDDEIHLRIYKNINNYELAIYGYSGFWKSPSAEDHRGRKKFTPMSSTGMSLRGVAGPGIANLEFSYYMSGDDVHGDNPEIENSQLRYLAGYSVDPVKDLNICIQYYMEQICDYSGYIDNYSGKNPKDQFRNVITASIVRSMMNQNLKLIFSGYYSPTDEDVFLRPKVSHELADGYFIETGANIFAGRENSTFFGQFEKNNNIYFAVSLYF